MKNVWDLYNLPPEPIADREVWSAAERLIRHHGERAALVAQSRRDRALELGELTDYRFWELAKGRALELQRTKPMQGEPRN